MINKYIRKKVKLTFNLIILLNSIMTYYEIFRLIIKQYYKLL